MASIELWPRWLRSVGIVANELNGFPNDPVSLKRGRHKGDRILWHHDGSPAGPSPGDVQWLISEYNAENPSAQIIVSYDGAWNFAGSGYASHAGVTDGSFTNQNSWGVETDQTYNEVMSPRMLDSLQRGFAIILKNEKWGTDRLNFHKIVARPLTRKGDPYFSGDVFNTDAWPGELLTQRRIIQGHIDGSVTPQPEPPKREDDEMITTVRLTDGRIFAVGAGFCRLIQQEESYDVGLNKIYKPFISVGQREFDVLNANGMQLTDGNSPIVVSS